MSELPHIDPLEGVRELILKWWNDDELPTAAPADVEKHVGEYPASGVVPVLDFVALDLVGGQQTYFDSRPLIAVDVFSKYRSTAKSLAAAISLQFLRYPDVVPVGDRFFMIDRAVCIQQPTSAAWEDENIRRLTARYELSVRR